MVQQGWRHCTEQGIGASLFAFARDRGAVAPPFAEWLEGPFQKISSPSRPGKFAIVSIKLLWG